MAETHHVVVDGSNLATEGRSLPSLAQLDDAVRAYADEDPGAEIIVVVDASFEHRIDAAERPRLEQAELHGEVVSPPAGAIGRGDAFILRIAERTGAVVLSNDSFQEFHGEYPWLFDPGRLVGGKPVPGVGWIFTPRTPVRGLKSRQATGKARREAENGPGSGLDSGLDPGLDVPVEATPKVGAKKASATKKAAVKKAPAERAAATKAPVEKAAAATSTAVKKAAAKSTATKKAAVKKAPAEKRPAKAAGKRAPATRAVEKASATEARATEAPAGKAPATKRTSEKKAALKTTAVKRTALEEAAPTRGAGAAKQSTPVNEPLAFITFVTEYPIGSLVSGVVASFTSHGAMVDVTLPGGTSMRCYLPLRGLADPPPTRARQVLNRGDRRDFEVVSLDPPRRVAELALPGVRASVRR